MRNTDDDDMDGDQDEHRARYAERPTVDSPSHTAGQNPFSPQPAPLRADRIPRHTSSSSARIVEGSDQRWDGLFDQLIARVDAVIAARQANQRSESVEETSRWRNANFGNLSRHRAVDPGNSLDPLCQLKKVLDSLAESPAARHLDASQDLDEPEWSDSDTAREMQRDRGIW
jgi:hypothetical protein